MADNVIRSVVGFVLMNQKGQYLTVTFRTTHTGNHSDILFVDSLVEADVFTEAFWQSQRRKLMGSIELNDLIQVPAVAETTRAVRLIPPSMPTAATPE